MEQINTLFDRSKTQDQPVLPEELKILYGGELRFPALDVRPYVIGNVFIYHPETSVNSV